MDFKETTFREALDQVLKVQQSDAIKNRIFGTLDLQVADCDEENRRWSEFTYKKREQHLNPYNGIHGGIACTIADSCMGSTLSASLQQLPSTTDMSVSFLEPMTAEEYQIRVDIKKTGRTLAACSCEIKEKDTGKLCVSVMGRFIMVKKDILAVEEASMLLKEQNGQG